MAYRSRLDKFARREERKTIKRIVYLSIFSIVIAIFLFNLGIPLLGKFADVLDKVFKKKVEISQNDKSSSLILDPLPEATNSARLVVSGLSVGGFKVQLFVNGEKVDETSISGGSFKFENVNLKNGENEINAKNFSEAGEENGVSETEKVILDMEEPRLEIDSPSDNLNVSGDNRLKVSGKTDKDAQVYANGFLAIVNVEGNFEVTIPLKEGENAIEVKAFDSAGNQKQEVRKVNFKK